MAAWWGTTLSWDDDDDPPWTGLKMDNSIPGLKRGIVYTMKRIEESMVREHMLGAQVAETTFGKRYLLDAASKQFATNNPSTNGLALLEAVDELKRELGLIK